VVALHKANFNVERGEVVGLLGPNGAGKSTTMKILTTYLYPTALPTLVSARPEETVSKRLPLFTHLSNSLSKKTFFPSMS
jgi:ABC-type multidrug transport system ATPase subunit